MSGKEEYVDDVELMEDSEDLGDDLDEDVGDDTDLDSEEGGQEDTVTMSQSKLDELISRRLARERERQTKEMEKRLAKQFGTKDLKEASALARAGRAVSKVSGVSPDEVYQRVLADAKAKGTPIDEEDLEVADVSERIERIERLLVDRFAGEALSSQEKQAKTEYGTLYDEYREDILDKAEETGMDLMDAATLVLRPHLKSYYAERAVKERQTRARRQVDATKEGATAGAASFRDKLTREEREVADQMGISYKDYFEFKQ